ncbi:MAG: hypothetical protein SGJ20_01310, partial [Planctomycetota bacterium]|nr:hypothetical protein [Planctomycetota bacterium]
LLQIPLSRGPYRAASRLHGSVAAAENLAAAADYFAPELASPHQSPDSLTDIYALGCLMYRLLSGRVPYPGGDAASKLQRHAVEPAPSLVQLGVPESLAQVVGYAMAKNRHQRYLSATQFGEALAYFLEPSRLNVFAAPAALSGTAYSAWQRAHDLVPSNGSLFSHVGPPLPPAVYGVRIGGIPFAAPLTALDELAAVATVQQGASYDENPFAEGATDAGMPLLQQANAEGQAVSTLIFTVPAEAAALPETDSEEESDGEEATFAGKVRRIARQCRNLRTGALIAATATLVAIVTGAIAFMLLRQPEPVAVQGTANTNRATSNPLPGNGIDTTVDGGGKNGGNGKANSKTTVPLVAKGAGGVPDDGKTLWTAPTAGSALSISYLPNDSQVILAVRAAELLRHAEGEKLLAALGPAGQEALQKLETRCGLKLSQIDHLLVGWTDQAGTLSPTLVVQPNAKLTRNDLIRRWRDPVEGAHGGATMYVASNDAYYFPKKESTLFVVGTVDAVQQSITAGEATPFLSRELVKLIATSDSKRTLTVLFPPSLFENANSELSGGPLGNLSSPTRQFFGESIHASAISMNLSEDVFLELRLIGDLDRSAYSYEQQFATRVAEWGGEAKNFVSASRLPKHSEQVLSRFPQMVQLLADYTRTGVDEGQVVLNCYLPATAAHNLLMSAELALNLPRELSGPARATGSVPTPTMSVAERLKKKITITFPKETLEKAMQILSEEIGVPVEILGGDLQLDGITKNQSLAIDEKDQPADQILQKIMLRANPDGKLVYVIKLNPSSGDMAIFITTRAAVGKRGDTLPPELVQPPKKINGVKK